jgi:hypothetical protein
LYFSPANRFTDIIFVDASSRENIEATLSSFAMAKKIGKTHTDTLMWLVACQERCLVVFDNADGRDIQLHKYFPQGSKMNILITTRHRDLVLLAQDSNSDYYISGMDSSEAQELLVKATKSSEYIKDEEKEVVALLVQVIVKADRHQFIYLFKPP